MRTKKEKIQQIKQLVTAKKHTQAQLAVIQKYGVTITDEYHLAIFDSEEQKQKFDKEYEHGTTPLICVVEN